MILCYNMSSHLKVVQETLFTSVFYTGIILGRQSYRFDLAPLLYFISLTITLHLSYLSFSKETAKGFIQYTLCAKC